ncbi:hypothetical protein VKT23_014371 [Stygiomarasmius scandens]|uniref:Uncharacterized protein n=1 Tax=Marasmiellus scandens TaxID=2682957 RepID=A0ABR1J0E6_9AGAR
MSVTFKHSSLQMDSPPKPRFSSSDICRDPSLLTAFAKPGSPLTTSFDGLCGNIIGDILVTSPNITVLYEPPLNTCSVRMRKDMHFGCDDPLYYPQPFNRSSAHLAVIRLPSLEDPLEPFSVTWAVPNDRDFTPSSNTFCAGLGVLEKRVLAKLVSLGKVVLDSLPERYEQDPYLCVGSEQLRRLLDRLQLAAPKEEILLRFRCTQRQLLELDARIRWVSKYQKLYESRVHPTIEQRVGDVPLLGAFTDDLDVLESLFQSKIPVYYIRSVSRTGDVRIDAVEQFIQERNCKINLHSGFVVDTSDERPSHWVVFTGLARNPERYLSMANYITSLFEYPSVLGTEQPKSTTSLHRVSLPFTPSMPMRQTSMKTTRSRPPYPNNRQQPNQNNSFLVPSSPLMPSPIDSWKVALEHFSGYNQSLRAPGGINRGYALPPADLFVNTGNRLLAATLFCNWLKLRQVFIYHLSSGVHRFSKKQWRQMLSIGEAKETRSDTRAGQHRLNMQNLLKDMMGETSVRLQFNDLASASVDWNGQTLDASEVPVQNIAKEILWELSELNFRQDLVALDHHLDDSGMSNDKHSLILEACWNGTRDFAHISEAHDGFGAPSVIGRVKYLKALHKVMTTWTKPKPAVLLFPFPQDTDSHNFAIQVERSSLS